MDLLRSENLEHFVDLDDSNSFSARCSYAVFTQNNHLSLTFLICSLYC